MYNDCGLLEPKVSARLKHGDDQCLNPQNEIPKHRHHLLGRPDPNSENYNKTDILLHHT
jgi:hypothetical protein